MSMSVFCPDFLVGPQKMPSTPFFFFLGSVLFLTWFTTDVHSEKTTDGLKGSSLVLSPGDAETSIISITWKHGADLAAEWFGGDTTFYRIFNDGCSLNTKTGELTINDVRPEHGGEYTPEINGKILSAQKLQVLSPVPKPRITPDCNPEKNKCTLTCSFDRTDDLGDVEVFWILDDRRENGKELQITKDTKEETFICSLKNLVSSENSTELKNPLFSDGGRHRYSLLFLFVIPLIGVAVFLIFHFKIHKMFRGRNEQRSSAVTENTIEDRQSNGSAIIPLSETQRLQNGSPAGGDADQPEESTSLLETAECNQTSNVTVTVEISPQTESNLPGAAKNPSPAPSSETKPDPESNISNTQEPAENPAPSSDSNPDPDSGSAENDLPEAERPEDSSGSPDGTVSTSEPS
ncbi:uncharacterized protein LOC105358837 isoform X4 [Oryzias latipes]